VVWEDGALETPSSLMLEAARRPCASGERLWRKLDLLHAVLPKGQNVNFTAMYRVRLSWWYKG